MNKNKLCEEYLQKCYYIPFTTMMKLEEIMKSSNVQSNEKKTCNQSLLKLQTQYGQVYSKGNNLIAKNLGFFRAVHKAVYSHDWTRLLYLLKSVPMSTFSKQNWGARHIHRSYYLRALLVLFFFHPEARAKGFFDKYLQMVLSCRSDSDKKAVIKVLLSLHPELISVLKPNEHLSRNEEVFMDDS